MDVLRLKIIGKYQVKGQGAECHDCATGADELFGGFEDFLGKEEVNRVVSGTKYHKCAKCKKDIIEKGCTSPDNKTYHQKCFACDECGQSIAGKAYGEDGKGNKVCEDYVKKLSSK